jgi:hypothetical protein
VGAPPSALVPFYANAFPSRRDTTSLEQVDKVEGAFEPSGFFGLAPADTRRVWPRM